MSRKMFNEFIGYDTHPTKLEWKANSFRLYKTDGGCYVLHTLKTNLAHGFEVR